MVFDINQQFSILSGDQIVPYLTEQLGAEKILMLTDVDGVYTKNPKIHSDAKLVQELNINDENTMKIIFSSEVDNSGKTRVTGEMGKKLDELFPILEKNIPVYILSGLKSAVLKSFLQNSDKFGTKIVSKNI